MISLIYVVQDNLIFVITKSCRQDEIDTSGQKPNCLTGVFLNYKLLQYGSTNCKYIYWKLLCVITSLQSFVTKYWLALPLKTLSSAALSRYSIAYQCTITHDNVYNQKSGMNSKYYVIGVPILLFFTLINNHGE